MPSRRENGSLKLLKSSTLLGKDESSEPRSPNRKSRTGQQELDDSINDINIDMDTSGLNEDKSYIDNDTKSFSDGESKETDFEMRRKSRSSKIEKRMSSKKYQ